MARRNEQADAIDRIIGNRIRQRREDLGITQSDLAQKAGVSYQQIHKYESGANRISAGRLGIISAILHTPIQHFFDEPAAESTSDNALCLEVARNFRQLTNLRQREALHMLIAVLVTKAAAEK